MESDGEKVNGISVFDGGGWRATDHDGRSITTLNQRVVGSSPTSPTNRRTFRSPADAGLFVARSHCWNSAGIQTASGSRSIKVREAHRGLWHLQEQAQFAPAKGPAPKGNNRREQTQEGQNNHDQRADARKRACGSRCRHELFSVRAIWRSCN